MSDGCGERNDQHLSGCVTGQGGVRRGLVRERVGAPCFGCEDEDGKVDEGRKGKLRDWRERTSVA